MTTLSDKDFLDLSDAAYSFSLSEDIGGVTLGTSLDDANGNPITSSSVDFYDPSTGTVYDPSTAFRAVIYANADKSVIVIAFRGTVNSSESASDAKLTLEADAKLASGGVPLQFAEGQTLFQQIQAAFPDAQIVLAGHSLGGAIAEWVAAANPDFFLSSAERSFYGGTFGSPGVALPSNATTVSADRLILQTGSTMPIQLAPMLALAFLTYRAGHYGMAACGINSENCTGQPKVCVRGQNGTRAVAVGSRRIGMWTKKLTEKHKPDF